MKKLALTLTAFGFLASTAAFADDKMDKTETHDTDGKKTTKSKKVKRSSDTKGNSEVKTETVQKTEMGKASGSGTDVSEKTETHDMDGKKTTKHVRTKHTADKDGGSAVKTEKTEKTEK